MPHCSLTCSQTKFDENTASTVRAVLEQEIERIEANEENSARTLAALVEKAAHVFDDEPRLRKVRASEYDASLPCSTASCCDR